MSNSVYQTSLYDTLVNANAHRVGAVSMRVLDRMQTIQGIQPGEQAAALALAFLAFCEASGLEPQDVFTATKNLVARSKTNAAEFKTVRTYIENEVIA